MHAKTLLFQPLQEIMKAQLARKRKTDAYQPDKRPPEIICPVFYALQKVSSSAQSA